MIGDGLGDLLADTSERIGRELEPKLPVKIFNGFHESNAAFLDQIGERATSIHVFPSDEDHKPEIRFNEKISGRLVSGPGPPRDRRLVLAREQRVLCKVLLEQPEKRIFIQPATSINTAA